MKKIVNADLAVQTLDEFISLVYQSTPVYVRERDPGACDMEAMSALYCGRHPETSVSLIC